MAGDIDSLDDPKLSAAMARAAGAWRAENKLRGWARSRSLIFTDADLQKQLNYLQGFPEAQADARAHFAERQAERDREMARRARQRGEGKAAARTFMQERRAFLKTLGKSQAGRWRRR